MVKVKNQVPFSDSGTAVWVPKYIKQNQSMRAKDVVTSSDWNNLFNLVIAQGDWNSDAINKLINTGDFGIQFAAHAENADKLGGKLPSYYTEYSDNVLSQSTEMFEEAKRYTDEVVTRIGAADMLMSTYDTNRNGIVDNAEALGGVLADTINDFVRQGKEDISDLQANMITLTANKADKNLGNVSNVDFVNKCLENSIGSHVGDMVYSLDDISEGVEYLKCDGAILKRSDYPKLAELCGTQDVPCFNPTPILLNEGVYEFSGISVNLSEWKEETEWYSYDENYPIYVSEDGQIIVIWFNYGYVSKSGSSKDYGVKILRSTDGGRTFTTTYREPWYESVSSFNANSIIKFGIMDSNIIYWSYLEPGGYKKAQIFYSTDEGETWKTLGMGNQPNLSPRDLFHVKDSFVSYLFYSSSPNSFYFSICTPIKNDEGKITGYNNQKKLMSTTSSADYIRYQSIHDRLIIREGYNSSVSKLKIYDENGGLVKEISEKDLIPQLGDEFAFPTLSDFISNSVHTYGYYDGEYYYLYYIQNVNVDGKNKVNSHIIKTKDFETWTYEKIVTIGQSEYADVKYSRIQKFDDEHFIVNGNYSIVPYDILTYKSYSNLISNKNFLSVCDYSYRYVLKNILEKTYNNKQITGSCYKNGKFYQFIAYPINTTDETKDTNLNGFRWKLFTHDYMSPYEHFRVPLNTTDLDGVDDVKNPKNGWYVKAR